MEDKKTIKISLNKSICLIISLFLLFILIGVVFYFNSANKTKQNNIISTTTEENNSENKLKIDETKELVYNANYTYGNLVGKSYKSETKKQIFSIEDIKVPYINIDSEDADKANKEIKSIFEECAERFPHDTSNYKYYINDNILSIIIAITINDATSDIEYHTTNKKTDIITKISANMSTNISTKKYKYYTYNFDLNTKKMLDYEGVYKKVGFSSDSISTKVEKAIKERYRDYMDNGNVNQYQNESIQNYNKSVVNNTLKFFLDSSKKLNIIVTMKYYDAQFDSGNEILTIE